MPRRADPVDPSLSPWHLLGAALRHWRELRHASLEEIGQQAHVDWSILARWERGDRKPPPDAIQRLDRVLNANGFLTALHALVLANTANSGSRPEATPQDGYAMDQTRRQLLQSFALMGTAGVLPLDAIEKIRQAMTTLVGGERLEDWEETAWEYAHALLVKPPAAVLGDLALDAYALQQVIRRGPAGDERGWAAVNARMAFLMADCLGLLGQVREASHWWRIARRAADLAGDPELQTAVRGYEATMACYAKRPTKLILQRIDEAAEIAGAKAYGGVAEAEGTRALLAALRGDARTALEAVRTVEEIYERLPDRVTRDTTTAFGWPRTRLLHTKSFVLARVGPVKEAQAAHEEAIAAYPAWRTRQITQVELHMAISAIRAGDVAAGVGHARTVLERLPAEHHTMFVRGVAAHVLAMVPPSEAHRPGVVEFRELLALPPAQ